MADGRIIEEGPPDVLACAEDGQGGPLRQVVLELLQNSQQAMAEAGRGGRVWVRTRKQVGRGTGLGLSVCHTMAQEHGGRLWAESKAGEACLVLELPAKSD